MFYYIKGPLTYSDAGCAVVEAGGVGYRLTVSQTTHDALPPLNGQIRLYTHMAVREDGIELFGFATQEELSAFRMLIGVSGVGPKVAVSVLSLLTPERFALAVSSEDSKTLGKASGVGAKTAARIILELKDKLSVIGSASPAGAADSGTSVGSGNVADATEALTVLGYTRSEILTAPRGLHTAAISAEDIIKTAMRRLMK